MFIVNKAGVMHTIPDDWALPAGARKATKEEIAKWEEGDKAAKQAKLARIEEERIRKAQAVVQVQAVVPPQAATPPKEK